MSIGANGTVHAEGNNNELINIDQQLRDQDSGLQEKQAEKETMLKEVQAIQEDAKVLDESIATNQKELVTIEGKITETTTLIEEKKEDIIEVSNKVVERKEILKNRVVSMQHNSESNVLLEILTSSASIVDIIQQFSYASQLFEADEDIFRVQEQDLAKIEKDKEAIDKQEALLKQEEQALQKKQEELNTNYKKLQTSLQEAEKKYSDAASAVTNAENEQAQLAEQKRKLEEQAKAIKALEEKKQTVIPAEPATNPDQPVKGKEMYVEATAYTPAESQGAHSITKYGGYNILAIPTPRLIAVDPRVIPPLSKVYVEGYGYAIAADTGGAIKGYKIDVLLPTNAEAYKWGRKKVKLTILE
jgi:3D (Asp-Asp-Asp) domain-containing protein/predicted  nucleic acid-binding Zn-ribbon protein